jgi:large subunit ribosomal protein L3
MSIGLIGNKIGMTQIFDNKGNAIAATVLKMGPCFITQIKSKEACGYNAIQIGYNEYSINKKKLTKPENKHFLNKNLAIFNYLKEFTMENCDKFSLGEKITVNKFEIGEYISITGFTIGKGTTGNIKLHNFKRGPMSHGSKHHRLQGSLGAGTNPGRVFPGKRMSKHSGMEKRTIPFVKILNINENKNLLVVKGSIPGKTKNIIFIKKIKN